MRPAFNGVQFSFFRLRDWLSVSKITERKEVFSEIIKLYESNVLKLPIESDFVFADFKNACIASENSGKKGKVILTN
jgi:NADPH:quinone reductase-like Zn-dependent oxidoreductase